MSSADAPPPSASEAPGSDRAGRFRRDLTAALAREVAPGDRLALAVSGGPDSMAMLWLAAAAFPGQVIAATVDHGLRPESADEAAMVARWCGDAGVPHATLAVETLPGASGNLQAWARDQRYTVLGRWALRDDALALCTAHHADDQAETFLMRASRATGLAGLAGIRARKEASIPAVAGGWRQTGEDRPMAVQRRPLATVRPLLRWRRAELRRVCLDQALPFVDDPSNDDARFTRTRLRAWLAQAPWIDPVQVARTAQNLAAAAADLDAIGRWLWDQRVVERDPDDVRIDVAGLPREVRRRLLRLALAHVADVAAGGGGKRFAEGNVERLLDDLERGGSGMKGDVLASADGAVWRFRPAPPRGPS